MKSKLITQIPEMPGVPKYDKKSAKVDPLAHNLGTHRLNIENPDRLEFVCDNSADVADVYFKFFDADGIVADQDDNAKTATAAALVDGIGATPFMKWLGHTNLAISGLDVRSKTSEQFSNPIVRKGYGVDKNPVQKKIPLQDALSGNQFDKTLQKYNGRLVVTPMEGWLLKVNKGEVVYVTVFLEGIWTL